jgi:exopolysaccharide production protein ExoQ
MGAAMTPDRPGNTTAAGASATRVIVTDQCGQSSSILLTPAVIGFYFAFRVIFVVIGVRLFLLEARTGVTLSLGCGFLLLLLVLFQDFGLTPLGPVVLLRLRPFRWVLVFLGFTGLSLTWTVAESVAAAAAFWCAMAADLAMVVMLMRMHPLLETATSLMRGFVCGACAVALAAWLLPPQSDLRLGDEELLGPNQIGFVCAFAMFLAQFLIRRKKLFWIAPAVFLGVTLLRTLSKTSILAFVAGQAFILIRDRSLTRRDKLLMAGAAACALAAFWGLIEAYYAVYTNAGSQAETLTGRLGLWAYFLDRSLEKPWIGHGFHSVWKVIPPFSEDFEARHAHNELLQQFYAYGLAGVVMLFGLYGSLVRQIRSMAPGPMRAFAGGFLCFILVRGLADTEAFDLSLPLWAITLFSAVFFHCSSQQGEVAPTNGDWSASSAGFATGQARRPAL